MMPTAPSRTILIVEDDLDIRSTVSDVLEDEGYLVASAANGREALEYLRRGATPALILLDLMMPVMNGWQFRSEQQRDPRLSAIPVLVLSADNNVREKAEALGAAGYIQKPLHLDQLLTAIERYGSTDPQ
jgi:CheY-like chemotaxis protein